MKKYTYLLLLLLGFWSCNYVAESRHSQRFSNPQQQEFDDMLDQFNDNDLKYSSNKIRKQEFLDSVKVATFCYVDSVRLFVNWEGKISHIDSQKSGGTTMLEFDIGYKPEQYREVTFKCKYLVPTDSLSTDELYQRVRTLRGHETVYFDGFIRTLSNNTVKYWLATDDLFLPYPKFEFFIVDISTTPKSDSIRTEMQDAINLTFEAIQPLKLLYEGKISKRESTQRSNTIAPKYDVAKSQLTPSEKKYIQRLVQACTYNFLFSEKNKKE